MSKRRFASATKEPLVSSHGLKAEKGVIEIDDSKCDPRLLEALERSAASGPLTELGPNDSDKKGKS